GDEVRTESGQRRVVALAGGDILYVNENTQVKLEAAGQLVLAAGEVYVAQAPADGQNTAVSVQAPGRKVTGQNSSFAVRAGDGGAGVLVTRGQVQVSGVDQPLKAGQLLTPGGKAVSTAHRPAQLLHWTHELMVAAEPALVPGSEYAGGALVAVDPDGQESKLSLRKYHIDVFLEDGFARTT